MCSSVNGSSSVLAQRPVLIFDFGGVLGGTDLDSVSEQIAPLLEISVDDALALLIRCRDSKREGISEEDFWQEYAKSSETSLPSDWIHRFEKIKRLAIRSRPEMLALVDRLRKSGYRVALFSNVTTVRANFIRKLGVYDHFDAVILSCDIGARKPELGAFKILLEKVGASSGECLFIDNDTRNIAAAARCGMECVVFESPEQLQVDLSQRGIEIPAYRS